MKPTTTLIALLCATIAAHAGEENLPGIAAQPASYFYTGKPYDSDLDAYAFAFRSYDPVVTRWTTSDPSGFPDGANNRFYAPNPTHALDPTGLTQYNIWAAAFISPASIIFPDLVGADPTAVWTGDGRGFGVVGGSSRAFHHLIIDTDPSVALIVSNVSGVGTTTVSYTPGGGFGFKLLTRSGTAAAPALASANRIDDCNIRVSLSASVGNPLAPFSPTIDYNYDLDFNLSAGRLTVTGSVDWYPWHELVISGAGTMFSAPTGPTFTPLDLVFSSSVNKTFTIPIEDHCE